MRNIIILILFCQLSMAQIINDASKEPQRIESDTIFIDPISLVPLYLETVKKINGQLITTSKATGFVFEKNLKKYLITNWHVVNSRNPSDRSEEKVAFKNSSGQISEISIANPEILRVFFHGQKLGDWHPIELNLYKNSQKLWLEHPLSNKVDVVAIPLEKVSSQIKLYSVKPEDFKDDITLYPSVNLNIVGFPLGFASYGHFPIWKTGQLASDFGLNYENMPIFLIDASTRGGMSGSPVIIRQAGMSLQKGTMNFGGTAQKFLGVYSGGLPNDSDIGLVWKIECIDQIIK